MRALALYHHGVSAAPPEVTINSICEAFGVDPVRAVDLWANHRSLVVAILDARSAAEVYRLEQSDPRGMTTEQVTWLTDLKEYYREYKQEVKRAKKMKGSQNVA